MTGDQAIVSAVMSGVSGEMTRSVTPSRLMYRDDCLPVFSDCFVQRGRQWDRTTGGVNRFALRVGRMSPTVFIPLPSWRVMRLSTSAVMVIIVERPVRRTTADAVELMAMWAETVSAEIKWLRASNNVQIQGVGQH